MAVTLDIPWDLCIFLLMGTTTYIYFKKALPGFGDYVMVTDPVARVTSTLDIDAKNGRRFTTFTAALSGQPVTVPVNNVGLVTQYEAR
jgi:hypothetical protein